MKSAYFSSPVASVSISEVRMDSSAAAMKTMLAGDEHGFPGIVTPFWNRQCVGFTTYLRSKNVVPIIVMNYSDVFSILTGIYAGDSAGQITVQLVPPPESVSLRQGNSSSYSLMTCENTHPSMCLTIPILNHSENEPNQQLLQNLGKALKGGRNFALKSCIRLRACGHCTSRDQTKQLSGTVRFEAAVPDVSFQVVQIKPIPILATPLTKFLISSPQRGAETGIGYVTVNRTRKLVFVQESDPCVPQMQAVGVWVQLPHQADVHHPFVWAACVRFLCADVLQHRVFVEADTFLLVLLSAGQVEYFEVSLLREGLRADNTHGTFTMESDFLRSDFTVDLSIDTTPPVHFDPVVCRFQPIRKHHARDTAPHLAQHTHAASRTPLPANTMLTTTPYHQNIPNSPRQNTYSSERKEEQSADISPRTSCPTPLRAPVSPLRSPGAPHPRDCDFESQQLVQDKLSESPQAMTFEHSEKRAADLANQIILSQQRALDELRAEVRALRQLVQRLGGDISCAREQKNEPDTSLHSLQLPTRPDHNTFPTSYEASIVGCVTREIEIAADESEEQLHACGGSAQSDVVPSAHSEEKSSPVFADRTVGNSSAIVVGEDFSDQNELDAQIHIINTENETLDSDSTYQSSFATRGHIFSHRLSRLSRSYDDDGFDGGQHASMEQESLFAESMSIAQIEARYWS